MRFVVVDFAGSNCDRDSVHVLRELPGVDCDLVWYKDKLGKPDGIVLPGGFSYGDYVRAGAIAATLPVMEEVRDLAEDGIPVLGICNGAQTLAECRLVQGTFTTNAYPKFNCSWVNIRVERNDTAFTTAYTPGDVIKIPIAHAEGRYVPPGGDIGAIEGDGRIVFRYCSPEGELGDEYNPNGSIGHLAGLCGYGNDNVLAIMPHPERCSDAVLGSADGRGIFESMVEYARK